MKKNVKLVEVNVFYISIRIGALAVLIAPNTCINESICHCFALIVINMENTKQEKQHKSIRESIHLRMPTKINIARCKSKQMVNQSVGRVF